jgi:hypothetical protein
MDSAVDALTLGIEEEYLLVDPQTGDLARDPPGGQLVACEKLVSLRALYAEARDTGADATDALRGVVAWLVEETKAGVMA